MAETIAAVGELILCAGLLIAVWLFIFGAFTRGEFEHRIVAAGSSLVALIGYCTIYSGQIRRISIQAISHWTADPTTINRADDHFRDADQFFTRLANYLSPGEHVGYRPYPTLIPLIILASVFTIRSLIYFSVTRRRFPDAGVTGPVYWSHISAYVMLVSFFIVIVNWNVAIVIAGSLALIVALIVPNLLEDIIFIVKSFSVSFLHIERGVTGVIAQASLATSRAVRLFVERTHAFYMEHLSDPIRRRVEKVVAASIEFENRSHERIAEEDRRHRERFGRRRRTTQRTEPPETEEPPTQPEAGSP